MDDVKYHIYFANGDEIKMRDLELPAMVFSPWPDKWNDFTYRTRFAYETYSEKGEQTSGEVHLAFLGEGKTKSPVPQVNESLRRASTYILPAGKLPQFYTMHFNMNSYREIVANIGPVRAQEQLLGMNDLVALRRIGKLPEWFNEATSSRIFSLAVIRESETFFAFHNAASILGGLEHESLEGLSKHMKLKFQLATFENKHRLEFVFDHTSLLPKRIAVIIGKNGVGKSQALAHFAQSLIKGDKSLRDGRGKKPIINRLLAISSPGESRTTFPDTPKQARIYYRRIILSHNFNADRQSGMGDLLIRLARSTEAIKEKSRWDLFCETVSRIIPSTEIAIRLVPSNDSEALAISRENKYVTLSEFQLGGEQQCLERWARVDTQSDVCRLSGSGLLPLSSGQLTFIRFAANACLYIENGTMVLFDEPETHLHPNLISDFVQLLDGLLEDTGSFAILATHSAYFVREVPGSQVSILAQPHDGVIEVRSPRLKTLGADIGAISSFVFGDSAFGEDSFERLLIHLKARLNGAKIDTNSLIEELHDDLPAEAIMFLRRSLDGHTQS